MGHPIEAKSVDDRDHEIFVLLVDDDKCVLDTAKLCLELHGLFKIETADSAKEGLAKIGKVSYDVIVSDYEMPEMNGLQFLEDLRKRSIKTPFVLFTGKGREEVAMKALNLGADGYYSKIGTPETVYGELSHGILSITNRGRVEQELNRSQHFLSRILDSSPTLIYIFDLETQSNVYSNREVWEFLGYNPKQISEMGSQLFAKILHPDDFQTVSDHHLRCAHSKSAELLEVQYRMRHANGEWHWLRSRDVPFLINHDGTVKQILGSAEDVTERKKAEEALSNSEAKYRALVENADDAILLYDLNGNHIYRNRAYFEGLGFEEGAEIEVDGFARVHPDDLPSFKQKMSELFKVGYSNSEYRVKHRNGNWLYRSSRSTIIYNQQRQPYAVIAIIRDITERKRAEDELLFEAKRLKQVMENNRDLTMLTKADGTILYVNSALKQITGYEKEEFMNKTPWIVHSEDSNRAKEIFGRAFEGKNVEFEHRIITKQGQTRWVLHSCSPILRAGKVVELVSTVRDITERKKTEKELSLSEIKYRKQFEDATDAMFLANAETGKILECNNAACELLERKKEEIIGLEQHLVHPDPEISKNAFLNHVLNPEKEIESKIITKNGKIKEVAIRATLHEINGQKVLQGIFRDITIYKNQEQQLLESQQKFKSLFRANPEAILFVNNDFRIVDVNSSFTQLFGYSLSEIKGQDITEIIVPDDQKEESHIIREKLRRGLKDNVSVRKRKDGKEIDVSISGSPVMVKGKPMGFVVVYKNLSDIMTAQTELSKALSKAEALNEKLSVVGGFTRHDVRNKLSAIDTLVYLGKKAAKENPQIIRLLEQIETASRNTVQILEDSKTFELLGTEKLMLVDVGKTFEKAFSLIASPKGIKKINQCMGFEVLADSILEIIFYNLIDNSLKYGGKLTQIRIWATENNDGTSKMVYEDDGTGIESADKKHLFEKGFGKGTGLGLYLVRRTCETYGWTISETGEPGKGVRFEFKIPKT
jgi:PAS domain S-box-containing protein